MANIFVLGRNWSKRNKQRNLWCRFDGIFFEIGETDLKWWNKKSKQDQYQQKVCDERCQRRHSFDNGKKRKSRRWLAIKRIILPFSKRSKRRWEKMWWDIVEVHFSNLFPYGSGYNHHQHHLLLSLTQVRKNELILAKLVAAGIEWKVSPCYLRLPS